MLGPDPCQGVQQALHKVEWTMVVGRPHQGMHGWAQGDDDPGRFLLHPAGTSQAFPSPSEEAGEKMSLLVFPGFKFLGYTPQRLLEYKQFLELSLGKPKFLLEISIPSKSMSVGDNPQK